MEPAAQLGLGLGDRLGDRVREGVEPFTDGVATALTIPAGYAQGSAESISSNGLVGGILFKSDNTLNGVVWSGSNLEAKTVNSLAGAIMLRSSTTLYGRYWGAREHVEALHFEACYYQGIDYCLREGLTTFEPGAGGEHKIARGFLPERTRSFHWIADPRFRAAIADALRRESHALDAYRDDVLAHSPYASERRTAAG